MVSLQSDFTTNSPARYFTEASPTAYDTLERSTPAASTAANMDDELIMSTDHGHRFKLRTVPAFSLHLLISAMISLAGVIMAAAWTDSKRCEAYFIMLYMRGIYWVITFVFHHYVKRRHEEMRLGGYLQFTRETAEHTTVPLYVVTVWNVAIAGIQTLMQQYYGEHFGEHCVERWLSPIVYVTQFAVLETCVLAYVHGTYIARVNRFNREPTLPDVLRGQSADIGSVGQEPAFGSSDLIDLIEKQADLIDYLRVKNGTLEQMLMNAHQNAAGQIEQT